MADMDNDRGRRRRGRRGKGKYDGGSSHRGDYHRDSWEMEDEAPPASMPIRPIILAKPHPPSSPPSTEYSSSPPPSEYVASTASTGSTGSTASTASAASTATPSKTPLFTLKTRDVAGDSKAASPSRSQPSIPSMLAGDAIPAPGYVAQRPLQPEARPQSVNQPSLATPPVMLQPIKIVDENLNWCNAGMEVLLDQTDYFVIGVIGLQGSGKSTIMSLLAAAETHRKDYKFRPQSYEMLENCVHQTEGIDMYVTQERIILLDTQPVLSASVLDRVIRLEKKYPNDYVSAENYVQMQSLQVASLLMAVCNVVLVAMDWFADLSLLKFVQAAEMLKPVTPSGQQDTTAEDDTRDEYYPHTVFILNKAERADFTIENYNNMQTYLRSIFEKSNLKLSGCVHMASGDVIPALTPRTVTDDINLYLIPETQPKKKQEAVFGPLPGYKGHPSLESLMLALRRKLFSLPRTPLTHTTLSEKNWFHYAARTWEAVKKSPLLLEYNRLLT